MDLPEIEYNIFARWHSKEETFRADLLQILIMEFSISVFDRKIHTLISLINVTSRLLILENFTLHETKIHPARLLISLQNFQYPYRTFNILTETNKDFPHGHFEL